MQASARAERGKGMLSQASHFVDRAKPQNVAFVDWVFDKESSACPQMDHDLKVVEETRLRSWTSFENRSTRSRSGKEEFISFVVQKRGFSLA